MGMFDKILARFIGTKDERELKKLWPIVEEINQVFASYKDLSSEDFPKKTEEFKNRYKDGELLDDLLVPAFALVKEATRRLLDKRWPVCGIEITWDMVPFDVQLIGAIVLHQGKIAEMKTGEGKTLVATMPLYLNALTGRGVHLVTVNDYLARRDSEWMGPIYEFLGMKVGCIQQGMAPEERKPQYDSDITYGTNNEFGFDYLRDNMVISYQDKVQRGHYYAIVDEVDSILIDEARTPLIISGPVETPDRSFDGITPIIRRLYTNQTILVNKIVDEGRRLLESGKEYEAGIKFLQARRGSPKNKQLMKVVRETDTVKLIEKIYLNFLRDKKFDTIDDELFYVTDEKNHTIELREKGRDFISQELKDPDLFLLPDLSTELVKIDENPRLTPKEKVYEKEKLHQRYAKKSEQLHSIQALLKAYDHFERDVDYIVQDGKVIIVDEFTGRLMPGRRYSDGLHQALEAKENVRVQEETQTLATITIQNYFRMYEKLAGMTGTATTEAREFWSIYKLDVVSIPTNEPVRRIDYPDIVYKTKREKYNAILDEIEKWHKVNRPILVGTTSVEVSETLSRMLRRRGINHQVLNAKFHQKEAEIVSLAGQPGSVTIATNMAGRGTDIKLGPGVVKGKGCSLIKPGAEKCQFWDESLGSCVDEVPCGLYVIGTERHEARRIDNQLRGRSGRQGDPGSSRFFLSLEDDLMRLFGSDRIAAILARFGQKEMEPMEHPLVSKAIANAQKRVEMRNFEIRKHLLDYDDVMNRQREVVYRLRNSILTGENLKDVYLDCASGVIERLLAQYCVAKYPEEWNWDNLRGEFGLVFLTDFSIRGEERSQIKLEDLRSQLVKISERRFLERKEELGEELFNELLKFVLLRTLDSKWRDHLYEIDNLREGIGLRGYGHQDPLIEYKRESFRMFDELMAEYQKEALSLLFRASVETKERRRSEKPIRAYKPVVMSPVNPAQDEEVSEVGASQPQSAAIPARRSYEKVGRNEPCPCGSGKKYKRCCGQK